ncbi:uncharacterized protein LOC108202669 isoform X2 [Daucus carota subsp. sativus]|uniref:uncharacterized protein LOC108202669 isoform X2 n=1 Tax=Daucus carota subsp. sativus TaxID=79200 RepID=UPI0007EF702D|nr:PREDICTED: nucleolin isoform X2 [Daucus carota subsp. sativus]
MPPKAAKRGAGGRGKRGGRGGRVSKSVPKEEPKEEPKEIEVPKEEVKIQEEEKVEEVSKEEVRIEENYEEDEDPEEIFEEGAEEIQQKPPSFTNQEEVKESVEEYERGERLDLEDNEPEDEAEEYGGVDYDEKEPEHDDFQEVEEIEEDSEGAIVGEEEGEEVEEINDGHEELGEEDLEHGGEGPTDLADAEEQEHHDVFKERRKRKEFEIFVGGLDKDASEADLRKVFSEVGEVTEVRLMMNPQTNKNKGFAFLRFATVEQAKRACSDLKNPVVNGKKCGVTQSQDSDTLFLGNICKAWTKEALKDKLKHYGVDNIEDLTLVEDSNNDGMNRGFAFLEFSSRSDAMDSFRRLQKRDVVFGVDRPAKVSFADSFIDPGDEIMAQVKKVFVDGLPASWDEDRVRDLLKKYGKIEKIELARNMPSAKRKDFGFITFDTHDSAVTCAKNINNTELGEGESKAKVRARLSRPVPRGKGKRNSRGDFYPAHGASHGFKAPWGRSIPPRSLPVREARGVRSNLPPINRGLRRPPAFRDRREVIAKPPRGRTMLAPIPRSPISRSPISRSYDRRPPPVPSYPKSSSRKDYGRREELPPRSRPAVDYGPRVAPPERRPSYRDEYPPRGSGYTDVPRSAARPASRRAYVDDGYGQRFERPPPSYREGRPRDYDSISGSKRPYGALDDVHPHYAEPVLRQSRPRLEYEPRGSASQYGDSYSERIGRSEIGYSSRSSIPSQDSRALYSRRQIMDYGGGSYSGSDVGDGMYSSSYSDYMSRGGDVPSRSYSSLYPGSGRGLGGSSYMGSSGSGSYY